MSVFFSLCSGLIDKLIVVCIFSQGLYVHHRYHNQYRTYYIRVGATSREASPEELQRLFQQRGQIRFDIKAVPGALFENLDLIHLKNYYQDIRQQPVPTNDDTDAWQRLLVNTEIMVEDQGQNIPSVGGLLLFGKNPNRYLPQAGISAAAYHGNEKDYDAIERNVLRGPIVSRYNEQGEILDSGLIKKATDFVRRNTHVNATIVAGRRIDIPDYPEEVIREAVVNAIVHRDYTISGTDIEISIYNNRLEITSPGRLPNTVTIERMKAGCRATRNELIKEVLRDYHYMEATGLGVPRKIIAGMLKHNGIEPDFVEDDYSFKVILRKTKTES